MQLNDIQRNSSLTRKRRVGRGGKRGKTSGRGHKGQKSRAGNKIRPAERDIIKRLPKQRGHGKNRARTVNPDRVRPSTVNIGKLDIAFADGDRVTPKDLVAKKLIGKKSGRVPPVKILGAGNLKKKITVAGCELSDSAKQAVEKAGGSVL